MTRAESIRTAGTHSNTEAFARDVQYYLSLTPRQLPSHYLYDALGSALFDAICELPWYPITRAERALIEAHRREILAAAGEPRTIVELGSGNGDKLALLLQDASVPRLVHLVDVSASALASAARRLSEITGVTVVGYRDQYEEGLQSVARVRARNERLLVIFLGSNLGNFDPPDAQAFLSNVRASLYGGDTFLVGVDLAKPESVLVPAYDDPLGITAAFNKNLLVRLNNELGANFNLGAFEHRAVWNADASRIEMHLESLTRQDVVVPRARLNLALAAGERIWTESSYKFVPEAFEAMLRRAGFTPAGRWIDERSRFLLLVCRAS